MKRIVTPLKKEVVRKLRAGQQILLSGIIYTARDQAHQKLVELLNRRKPLSLELKDQIIYYCGPTKTPPSQIIGSCGPTTSLRMDKFVEPLLEQGLLGMIGKGRRTGYVRALIKKHKAVYFLAPAGCGAMLAKKVISKKLVCFRDYGPEAVYKLQVRDFPLIVGIDSKGRSIY